MDKSYRALIEHIPAVTYINAIDKHSTPLYVSPQIEGLLGYTPDEWLADPQCMLKAAHADDRERVMAEKARTDKTLEPFRLEYRLIARDEKVVWVRNEGIAIRDAAGTPRTWQGVLIDITERKALEEQLAYQAFHDPLTALANRALFMDRLQHAQARSVRDQTRIALLYLDLDRFKVVNDSLGHEAGDKLLVEVGRRLRDCLRTEDTLARLGGDEFTILLEDVPDVREPVRVAERICKVLRAPFAQDAGQVFTSASIGIVLSTPAHNAPHDLLREADIAMYRAKDRGRARFEVFDASMNAHAAQCMSLETQLRQALERGEFEVYYMPKVELATGKIVAMEALLRWRHPTRGIVSPTEFIAMSEDTGLILPVGKWVLQQACRQLRTWQEAYPSSTPLLMAVNLSAMQFQQSVLMQDVTGVLCETAIDPATLVLEITERVVMEDAEANAKTLQGLKQLGVQLAVDDFGTGYSSLGYLKRYPVDILKIDKSFVDGLGRDDEDTAIVRAIISLAEALKMLTVAEGVETYAQMAQLQVLGCGLGQGYYFARPSPDQAAASLIARATLG